MLEGMTTLGFIAAHTSRARLGLMVGGVHYRQAALWVKATTTLDVLSGGRAWLGIGAAWNEQESTGSGSRSRRSAERFEMLEETLQIAHDMWSGRAGHGGGLRGPPYRRDAACSTRPSRSAGPRPPIMIGGGGERKTLRLVAQYADATQRLRRPGDDPPQVRGAPRALRGDRARPRGDRALDAPVRADRARRRATARAPSRSSTGSASSSDAGAQHVIFSVRDVWDPRTIERLGRDVLPEVAKL